MVVLLARSHTRGVLPKTGVPGTLDGNHSDSEPGSEVPASKKPMRLFERFINTAISLWAFSEFAPMKYFLGYDVGSSRRIDSCDLLLITK